MRVGLRRVAPDCKQKLTHAQRVVILVTSKMRSCIDRGSNKLQAQDVTPVPNPIMSVRRTQRSSSAALTLQSCCSSCNTVRLQEGWELHREAPSDTVFGNIRIHLFAVQVHVHETKIPGFMPDVVEASGGPDPINVASSAKVALHPEEAERCRLDVEC